MNFYILLILITMDPCDHVCCVLFARDHPGDHIFTRGKCSTAADLTIPGPYQCNKHDLMKVNVGGPIKQASSIPEIVAHHVKCDVEKLFNYGGIQINGPVVNCEGHLVYDDNGQVRHVQLTGKISGLTSEWLTWRRFPTDEDDSYPVVDGIVHCIMYCSINGYVVIPATSNGEFPERLPCCDSGAKLIKFVLKELD